MDGSKTIAVPSNETDVDSVRKLHEECVILAKEIRNRADALHRIRDEEKAQDESKADTSDFGLELRAGYKTLLLILREANQSLIAFIG
jgi:hypothetical protein